jgi:hypothetical protein
MEKWLFLEQSHWNSGLYLRLVTGVYLIEKAGF